MSNRRLSALRVGNFKAFSEVQRIPLKPITLIFGPNSAGKSSFIHSLALAHEAQFGGEKPPGEALDIRNTKLGGTSIDLGGFRQFVYKGQLNRRVEWGAELHAGSMGKRITSLLPSVITLTVTISIGMDLDEYDRPYPLSSPAIKSIEILADGQELIRMSERGNLGRVIAGLLGQLPEISAENAAVGLEMVKNASDAYSESAPTRKAENAPALRIDRVATNHSAFKLSIDNLIENATTAVDILPEDYAIAENAVAAILPNLLVTVAGLFPFSIEINGANVATNSAASAIIAINKGNRAENIDKVVRSYFPGILSDLIKGIFDGLSNELKQVQYLGPLRSFPPRHLAVADQEDSNWFAGGGFTWDVVRKDAAVRSAVNAWLGSSKLKTPYLIEVRPLATIRDLLGPITDASRVLQSNSAKISPRDVLNSIVERLKESSDLDDQALGDLERQRDNLERQRYAKLATMQELKAECDRNLKELDEFTKPTEGLHSESKQSNSTGRKKGADITKASIARRLDKLKHHLNSTSPNYDRSLIESIEKSIAKVETFESELTELDKQLSQLKESVSTSKRQRESRIATIVVTQQAIETLPDFETDNISATNSTSPHQIGSPNQTQLKESIWDDAEDIAESMVSSIERADIKTIPELVLVDQRTGAVVTHRDVGIGISQVLPVLVTAYASRRKIIAMEQPEIHLHPALQAELGDVFIESALGERQNTLILETHSEHLILRLLRRIREGKLSPDDLGVLFFEPLATGSRVVELGIDEDGDFIDEWPGGFFEESYREKMASR